MRRGMFRGSCAGWVLAAVLFIGTAPAWAYGPITLQNAATATGVGTVLELQDVFTHHTIQAVMTGTATVLCQGSTDNSAWDTLATLTASGSCVIEGAWKYIRANLSVCTSCTATAKAVLGQ